MHVDTILLSGKQGSGKTTTTKALEQMARLAGYDLVCFFKFAAPLYELHDLILDHWQEMTGIPRVKKDGHLLQLLGTNWGRAVHGHDVWVNILKSTVTKVHYNNAVLGHKKAMFIIDDCRFENEFLAFPEALRVRLNASEDVRKKRAESWREDTLHPSETALDLYDLDGRFDLYLQTDLPSSSSTHCATLIMAQLAKRSWLDKRPAMGAL